MRYQERIYIQNENGAVRNKDILNVNMSSDICIFESPLFNLSGATKIDCTGVTASYIISASTTNIPLDFQFTGNTDSFTATNATFTYEIYKYNATAGEFLLPPVYTSSVIQYSAISGTSSVLQNIPVSGITLDGDYLVKGYFNYDVCTDFLGRLGKKINTRIYMGGDSYGLYDKNLDYYFMAMTAADVPMLLQSSSNIPPSSKLFQQVILPEPGTINVVITNGISGMFVLTLNGIVLAPNLDYTYSGNIVTLNSKTVEDDIITIIYNTSGGNNLVGDNIDVTSPIISGTTNNEGTNNPYFNTTTGKFEIYTSVSPQDGGSIIVMINGATLANGVDYYQSSSNPKRIILEGNILVGDILTIVYYPKSNVINGLITNNPNVSWQIAHAPQQINGVFTVEVSTGTSFSTLFTSASTDYQVGVSAYNLGFTASGNVGTKLYYRVKNQKNYSNICGDIVSSTAYSEIIPLTIQTNSINSY